MLERIISVFFTKEVKINSMKVIREKDCENKENFKLADERKDYANRVCEKILRNAKVTDGVIEEFNLNRDKNYKLLFNACKKR